MYNIKPTAQPSAVAAQAHLIIPDLATDEIISISKLAHILDTFYTYKKVEERMLEGEHFELVYDSARPIGFASFIGHHDGLQIKSAFIQRKHRGYGIFCNLMLPFAKTMAMGRDIRLFVARNNHQAIAAYKHAGFTTGEEVDFDIGGGHILYDVEMRLRA